MSNPLFAALGGRQTGNNPFKIVQDFINFKNSFKGNPQDKINELLRSGQISQQQLNDLQGTANQLGGLLQQFMNMK